MAKSIYLNCVCLKWIKEKDDVDWVNYQRKEVRLSGVAASWTMPVTTVWSQTLISVNIRTSIGGNR